MNFNSDQYSILEIKKMFNISEFVNIFKDYTLQDIEMIKKKLYSYYKQEYPMQDKKIQVLLDSLGNRLLEDKFASTMEKPQSVLIKNTVKDDLNPNYKNTITRVTKIDSQYRPTIFQCNYPENCIDPHMSPASETMFSSKLTDTLNNTVSIKISSVSIPYSFYNINTHPHDALFTTDISGESITSIPDGNYTVESILNQINNSNITFNFLTDDEIYDVSFMNSYLDFTYNILSGKTTIKNNLTKDIQITFFNNKGNYFNNSFVNSSLGWLLGFRKVTCEGDNIYSTYTIPANGSVISEYISYIPNTKYFVIVLDDHNNTQSSKSVVQLNQGTEYIKPTKYYKNINDPIPKYTRSNYTSYYSGSNQNTNTVIDNNISGGNICLDTLKRSDLKGWTDKYNNRQLTKKQIYTQAAINDTNDEYQYKIEQQHVNNVLAIISFDSKSLIWGRSIFYSDKNSYSREYHGPVDIEKVSIKIYDDKGKILNLNGQDWTMTLLSNHLYKY